VGGERIKWSGPVTLRGRYDGVVSEWIEFDRPRRSRFGFSQLRHDMTLLDGRHVSFLAPYKLTRLMDEIDPGDLIEIQYTGGTSRSRIGRPVKEFIVDRLQPPSTPADKIAQAVAALQALDDDELESLLSPVDLMLDGRGRTEDPPGPLADAEHDARHQVAAEKP